MIKVQVRPNEPLESALRRFKRQCNYAGIFRLAKKYSFFEKRSDTRRREGRERLRSIQRAMRKMDSTQRPGRGGRRRKWKMRTSTVTPESAARAAEEAAKAPEPEISAETIPAAGALDVTAISASISEAAPATEVKSTEVKSTEVKSPQQAES